MGNNICDTCLYKYCCMDSDAGIIGANHPSCNGYAPIKNEEGGTDLKNKKKKETTFDDYLKEQLKDPEFRKEWEKLCDEEVAEKRIQTYEQRVKNEEGGAKE